MISEALRTRGLKEIPSEFIEPYLKAMLSVELECIEYRPTEERLEEAKQNLRGVERFVSRFCGVHSRYAVTNVYEGFYRMTLEQANKIFREANPEYYAERDRQAAYSDDPHKQPDNFDYGMSETHDNY